MYRARRGTGKTGLARKAADCLVDRDRMALLLREEGLDHGEIAAALDLSGGSAGITLSHARRRLADLYEAVQLSEAARRNNG